MGKCVKYRADGGDPSDSGPNTPGGTHILSIMADYWASFTAFLLFGVLHSLGAREPFKDWLAGRTSRFFVDHFWRLIYCVASYVARYQIIGALHWGQHPDANVWLVAYPQWLWRVLVILHLFSIALIYAAFIQSDYLEFWGVKQVGRGLAILLGKDVPGSGILLFGTDHLVVDGLYGWVRHPMLVGGLLFLLTSGPSKNNLVFLCMYAMYMVVGAYYEERRLIRIFGDQYQSYQRQVGAFIPRLGLRPRQGGQ